jgi:hypothetical protein
MKFSSWLLRTTQLVFEIYRLNYSMKKQLTIAATALVLAVTSTTSFAQTAAVEFGLADITNTTTTTFESIALAELNTPHGFNSAIENVALVAQVGDANIAYVNQTGAGNFAAIVQNASTATVSNVAVAIQTGDNNRAVIIQK